MLNGASTGLDGLGAAWSEPAELLITITGVAPTSDGADYPPSDLSLPQEEQEGWRPPTRFLHFISGACSPTEVCSLLSFCKIQTQTQEQFEG